MPGLSKSQEVELEASGYLVTSVPNLRRTPFMNFFTVNRDTGELVTMNLPADDYSVAHYKAKGFVTDARLLAHKLFSKHSIMCPNCGRAFGSSMGLKGHTHGCKSRPKKQEVPITPTEPILLVGPQLTKVGG